MKLYFYEKKQKHTSSDTENLILESLESCCGKPQSAFRVYRNENGKPLVCGNEYYVGVTHTDKLIVIGVDTENFGIDCENADRKVNNADNIAKKYFSDKECDYILAASDDEEKNARFLEIWVKKEAYVKYLGTGIKDLKSFCVFSIDGSFEKVTYGNNIIYIYRG